MARTLPRQDRDEPPTLAELERELAAARFDAVKHRRRCSKLRAGLRALLEQDAAETAETDPHADGVTNG